MLSKRAFLFCFCLFSAGAGARWAEPKEAAVRIELQRAFYKVAADGTFTKEVEFKAKILKESAISSFGSYRLTYNEHSEKLNILSAKVISKGKERPVAPHHIEDKPLASVPNGFDQHRQILITFPHVQVGSRIHLRYRHHFKIVPFKNFFSFGADFGYYLTKNRTYHIESELPLFYKINNPGKALKVSYRIHKSKNGNMFLQSVKKSRCLKESWMRRRFFWIGTGALGWSFPHPEPGENGGAAGPSI